MKSILRVGILMWVAVWSTSCDQLEDDNPIDPFSISRIFYISGQSISVDGKADDWGEAVHIAADPLGDNTGIPGTDITEVYAQYDSTSAILYVRMDFESFAGQPEHIMYLIAFDLGTNNNWDYLVGVHKEDGSSEARDLREAEMSIEELHEEALNTGEPLILLGVEFAQDETCEIGVPVGDILEGDRYFAVHLFVAGEDGLAVDAVDKFLRVTY